LELKEKQGRPYSSVWVKRLAGVSILCDNILRMRYELKEGMAREIRIIKSRGSPHERRVRYFEITGKGMVVHTPALATRGRGLRKQRK
jgi:KaiC/GvpD/RAD55 family RecA-like ATPase